MGLRICGFSRGFLVIEWNFVLSNRFSCYLMDDTLSSVFSIGIYVLLASGGTRCMGVSVLDIL